MKTHLAVKFIVTCAALSAVLLFSSILLAQVGQSQNQATAPAAQQNMKQIEDQANLKAILKPSRFDDSDNKIEVVILSWYGCGTCRRTDSTTNMFGDSLPEDVRVVKLPAMFEDNDEWYNHAKLFLVLEELGLESKLRSNVFETVQQAASPTGHSGSYGLISRESQETYALTKGISKADFNSAYDSPNVEGKLARIRSFVSNAALDAVPGMIINGRYVFTFVNGPGYYELAQKLIDQERKRLGLTSGGKGAGEKTEG
jgi:thiol:disulfide interchange protein DsbA